MERLKRCRSYLSERERVFKMYTIFHGLAVGGIVASGAHAVHYGDAMSTGGMTNGTTHRATRL